MVEADFFGDEEELDESAPDYTRVKIANYVSKVRSVDSQIEAAEDEIRRLKGIKDDLELRKIPDALLEAGLSEITTMDGLKVTTKLFVGAIPREKKQEAYSWMDSHGHGSLIKREVSVGFDKGSIEAAKAAEEAIRQLGLEPKVSMDVHHMTWSSFAKEQTKKGVSIPFEDWGVYYGQRATIK
jgi:hypothetical protein